MTPDAARSPLPARAGVVQLMVWKYPWIHDRHMSVGFPAADRGFLDCGFSAFGLTSAPNTICLANSADRVGIFFLVILEIAVQPASLCQAHLHIGTPLSLYCSLYSAARDVSSSGSSSSSACPQPAWPLPFARQRFFRPCALPPPCRLLPGNCWYAQYSRKPNKLSHSQSPSS